MKPHHNLAQWGNPGKAGKLSLGNAAPPPVARNNSKRAKPTPDFLLDGYATASSNRNMASGHSPVREMRTLSSVNDDDPLSIFDSPNVGLQPTSAVGIGMLAKHPRRAVTTSFD